MYVKKEFDLGRNALKYLVHTYKIKKLHLPYYLCDVIRHTLVEEGCKPVFYHIDDDFFPACEFSEKDFVLYPNYWGVCETQVQKLSKKYPNLIVDNAHAFFDEPRGFACFNAGHKFGFNNSFLWIKENNHFSNLNNQYSEEDTIKKRHNEFLLLNEKYKNINTLNIDLNSKAPFCYPCLTDSIEQADELVKKLKEEGKIIYRYWNSLPKSFCEYKFYSRLVPIPILP